MIVKYKILVPKFNYEKEFKTGVGNIERAYPLGDGSFTFELKDIHSKERFFVRSLPPAVFKPIHPYQKLQIREATKDNPLNVWTVSKSTLIRPLKKRRRSSKGRQIL